jgi:hypothetical protein
MVRSRLTTKKEEPLQRYKKIAVTIEKENGMTK